MRTLAAFVLVAMLFSASSVLAQKSSGVTNAPIPDFSRLPDPSLYTSVDFQRYDKQSLTFSATVRYVLVPVIVTDRNGKPVTGLKKEDFHLFENGKEHPIASVEEQRSTSQTIARAPAPENEFSNALAVSGEAPRRLVIIAFDIINTPLPDQPHARQQLIDYISKNLDPTAVYQLVSIEADGLHILHDYTSSTTELVESLNKVKLQLTSKDKTDVAALNMGRAGAATSYSPNGGAAVLTRPISTAAQADVGPTTAAVMASPDEMQLLAFASLEVPYSQMVQAQNAAATLDAFQQIARRASGIPGRKSLVWITGGFPFSLDPSTGSISVGASFERYQHVMQILSDNLIAVYPVDAAGLLTLQPDASMKLERSQLASMNALLTNMANHSRDIQETMRAFADMTGGRAYVNRNDIDGAVRDAATDGSQYYILSYPVDKDDKKPGWRKINVKVADYNVRARRGYHLTQVTVDPVKSAKSDMDSALGSPFDYTGIPLRLVLANKEKLGFTVLVPPNSSVIDPTDNHLFLEIAYAITNAAGKDAGHKGTTYNLKLDQQQLAQLTTQGIGYGDTLSLSPGKYQLRVVVRDNLSGRVGSVAAPIEVK
jgi:VWFA-related protein